MAGNVSTGTGDSVAEKWVVFTIAYLLMLLFALPLQELPPLFRLMREEIPFSHSSEGFLMGAYGIPGLFMPIAAALLAARFNTRRMLVAGCLILALGLLVFGSLSSYPALVAGRITAGIGGKIILSLAPLLVIAAFRGGRLGVVIGIFNSAVPLGSILSLNLFGIIGPIFGWRRSTWMLAAAALIMGVVSAIGLLRVEASEENKALARKERSVDDIVWLLAAINFIVNLVTLAYITFSTQFYQQSGLAVREANFLSSFILIATVVCGPIAGWLIDRFDHKRTFLTGSALLMAVSLAMMAVPSANFYLWTGLLGVSSAVVPVVMFPLLNSSVPPQNVSLAIAILIIASNLGGTIGPFVFGWILDVSDSFRMAFTTFAVLTMGIVLLVLRLRSRKPVHALTQEPPEIVL